MKAALKRQGIYAAHVLGLIRPDRRVGVHEADKNQPGSTKKWTPDERRLLIEEGRRQLDRQDAELERVRSRSQVLLALGLALAATTASTRSTISDADCAVLWILWAAALACEGWSVLGAAATAVVRADMEIIHAAVLSRREDNIEESLADDYAAMVMAGENQVATRVTNTRIAVVFLLVGGALTLGSWLVASSIDDCPAENPASKAASTANPASSSQAPALSSSGAGC
jgi:hypothetical protein